MATLTSNLVHQTHQFSRNAESTDGSISMDSNYDRDSPSNDVDNESCCSEDTVLSVGNENPVVEADTLSFKNIENHLNAISKITNTTLDPEGSHKSNSPSPLSNRFSPSSSIKSASDSPSFSFRNTDYEKSSPNSPVEYINTIFRPSLCSPASPNNQKLQFTSGPSSPENSSPKPPDLQHFYLRQNLGKNISNNNEPNNSSLKFSIDNILKADFGRRITDPINIRKSKPKKVISVETEKSLDEIGKSGPVDLSKPDDGKTDKSSTEQTSSTNQPILWPAWVYCTRYSDRPSSVKEEFNILEKEIYSVDSVGAKIDADFILEYIEINERGVIIEVKEETLDYIELDTLPSTVTVKNDLDVSFSDVGSIISSEETSDTKLVKNYLLSILPGKQLIEEYQNTEQLCDRSRKLLVNLVVSYLVENCPNSKPSKLEKEICAKSIIDLFPKLKDRKSNLGYEAFYNPSTGSGFITNRLKTIKRNSTTNLKSLDKRRCMDNKENIDLVEVQEDIKFLKFSTKDTPTEEIFQRMKNTFAYRRTISNKLEEFPRFLDTYGLINQDFELIYPNKDYPTKERFVEFREKIFNIYNNTITKKTFNPILDGVDVWDKNINAIIALIHLLPPTAQGRYKAQREARTSAESRFIYFQKTGTPLTDIFAKKVTKQPFLVGIGTSKASIYQYYVCMDNNLFEAGKESFDGIDLLFKIHFVFDVQYDINLKGVYSFLESEFYKIQDHVNITPRMRELRAKLYKN